MKTQFLIAFLCIFCATFDIHWTFPTSKVELYRINQKDENSTRRETGYLIDGSLVVVGFYEFNGDDGFIHSTKFTADKNGYRAKISQRPIGTPFIDNEIMEPGKEIIGEIDANEKSTTENTMTETSTTAISATDSSTTSEISTTAVSVTDSSTISESSTTSEKVLETTSETSSTTVVDSSSSAPYLYLPPSNSANLTLRQ